MESEFHKFMNSVRAFTFRYKSLSEDPVHASTEVKADLGSSASGGSVEGASCSSSAGAVSSPSRDSESSGSEDGPHSIPPYPRQHPGPAASLSSSSSSESTGGLQALRTALSKFRVPNPIAIHSKTGSSATKHLDRQQQLKELGHSQPESLAVRYTSFPGCGGRKSRSEGGSARRRRVHSPAPSLRFSTGRPRKPGVPLQASRSPHPHSDPDSTGRDCDCGGRGRSSLAKSHSLGSAENVDASVAGGKRPRSKSAERFQALRINNNNDRKNRNNSERRHHRSRSLEKHSGHRLEGTLLRLELGTRTVYRNYEKRILVEGKEEGDFHLDGEAVVTHIVMPRTPTDSGGPFINKPALGWLHPDTKIANEGITYGVRYIGCLGVNASMKTLDYDTRSQVAVECINRVCEAAGLKTVDKKRKVDKRIGSVLDEKPCMDHAGSNVTLRVTSACLRLCSLDTGQLISSHDMPNISFASGGDADTLDFVAFVAKDGAQGRACYVLECGGGLAQDVITTIGQAFELRFKEYLKKAPRTNGATSLRHCSESTSTTSLGARGPALGRGDPETDQEYYNDLPGKIPPDLGPTTSSLPPPLTMAPTLKKHPSDSPSSSAHRDASSDLIDLNSHPATPTTPATRTDVHEYVNDSVVFQKGSSRGAMGGVPPAPPPMPLTSTQTSIQKDPFDMQPFTAAIPSTSLVDGGGSLKAQLEKEPWFHGAISRKEAEALLKHDGEFLVRESQGSGGQYVLTGMQGGQRKHLLLVDPEGVVRTKDRTFESVSHLINYHRDNSLPIISAESTLLLRTPVNC